MKQVNKHCIKHEIMHNKKKKATFHVKENGVDIPLCSECYKEWLLETDFLMELKEENNGNYNAEVQ